MVSTPDSLQSLRQVGRYFLSDSYFRVLQPPAMCIVMVEWLFLRVGL